MKRAAAALSSALVCAVALAVAGVVGLALKQPWVFPSLGPTLMVIAETPDQPAALARNVMAGHLVGVLAGWGALAVTGTLHARSVIQEGLTTRHLIAACISLAVTTAVLQALDTPHPPAGATTLIVSLGILKTVTQLGTIVLAVALVSAAAYGMVFLKTRGREGAVPLV